MSRPWDRWRRRATDVPRHRRYDHSTRQPWWFRACIVSLLGLVTLFTGANGTIFDGISVAFASPAGAHAQRPSDRGTPNRFDPKSHTTSTPRTTQRPGPSSASKIPGGPPVHMRHQQLFSMRPGVLALHANSTAHFDSSDGHLSVDVPAGVVTDADLAAAAGGALGLRITQIAPSSGSSAGGSGLVSFGTYLIQVVDGQGVLVKHGLHKPVTLTFHYGSRDSALDLSRAFVVFNGSLPNGIDVAPLAATVNEPAAPGSRRRTTAPSPSVSSGILPNGDVDPAAIGLGSYRSQHVTFDSKKHTLTVQPLISTPSTSLSWDTNSAVASFGKPDPFNVDLSGGGLSAGYPIDVPAGPGGLTPPVSLSYSSASVAEAHGPQAAAGWAGEGWNLGLGAVSWAEHNVTSSCAATCGNTWEDSWQLSDPFGTGAELIPPNINVATYYEDSPNSITPSPVQWHTAPETHAKVFSYVGPVNPPDSANVHTPCFRVFLTNGIMEEFGCTDDSLEYYYTPGKGDYIANWNLDLITDPQGNQIHITYQQDTEQKNVSGTNHTYVRDAVLSTIEYDSPGCRDAQTACTGTAWAPLVRVNFVAGHRPTRLTNTPANCNPITTLRCDDPADLSGSNGLGVPDVQSTFVLNDIQVQVRSSGTGSWTTLKDYQLGYEQNGPLQITDPSTGKAESSAGRLLLKTLTEAGDHASALVYSGMDMSETASSAYMKVFDVSAQNLTITPSTTLTYWIYPQSNATSNLVTTSATTAFNRYYNGGAADHWVTTGSVASFYNPEVTLGYLYTSAQSGTQALYGCQTGGDHFISLQSNCEGVTFLRTEGYLYSSAPTGIPTVALYRCLAGTDHFVSTSSTCEGYTVEQLLGYAPTSTSAMPFNRYYNPGVDHWVTTGMVASGYNLEATLGYLYTSSQTGMQALYGCQNGSDHFISLQATCEGYTVLRTEGYLYSSAPTGIPTVALYRCLAGTDHFVSTSSTCEGFTVQALLGYALKASDSSTCAAIDMQFTDGTNLRDSGALDQNNVRLHPAYQCTHLQLDQWNQVTSNIGQWVAGKTVSHIDVGYDQPANTGGYRGYVDDISLTSGSTALFSTGLDVGEIQPTWTNTANTISNVGGICCDLTGPELRVSTETARNNLVLPTRSFSYTQVTEYYEDDLFHPNPTNNCGPSWNTGNGSGCILWSQNHDNNSWFLNAADNGLGLHQDFAWALARNNTHNTNGNVAANNANPFYCNGLTGYPCNEADDQNWSRVVLTSETSSVVRAASTGNTTVSSTTSYSYLLKTTLAAQECSDCGVDMYWGNINDGDYLDYYNAKYMGFTETDVTHPDGAKDVHKFLTTDGYGIYDTSQVNCYAATQPVGTCGNDAWWRLDNVAHGHEYETDSYDTNGTTLLKQTVSQYRALCPASGVGGTPTWTAWGNWNGNLVSELDHNNPVSSCDVQLAQSFDYDVEGSSAGSTAPTVAKTYSYDSYGRPTVTSTRSNGEPGLVTVEAETATVVSAGAPTVVNNNCCNILWSNGAERVLQATATGQALTLSFSVPSAGTYTVAGLMTTSTDNGISSLAIDGTTVGGTFDGYSNPTSIAQPVGYGQVTLTAGTHQATWTATGKNAASSNYAISIDALVLQKTGTSPAISLSKPAYIYNDAVTATSSGATGTYLIGNTAFSDNEDAFGNRYGCSYTSYDGQTYATGQQSTLTLGEMTKSDTYTSCGTAPSYTPSGLIETTHTYDAWGNQITTKDPDANAGVSGHVGCTVSAVQYTACKAFDSTFETLPTSSSNALNQTESTGYGTPAASNGGGLWPISTTDKNGQTTSYTYDALGRMTGRTLPGEGAGLTTTGWSYTFWCSATGAQAPCIEIDQTQRLDSTTTVTTRAFYDGFGDLVETREPGPSGQDVVRYRYYDAARHDIFDSISYFVTAYTGAPGAAAYSTPDATQVGTTTTYDGAGRPLSIKDPLSHTATTSYAVACNLVSADGSSCYVQTTATDALSHQSITVSDALGHETYDDRFTGNSNATYALYALTHYAYDYNGNLVTITHPNSSTTTTFTYDAAGRLTNQSDPDRGTETYTLDANGNRTQSVDARGASGTVYAGYDGLDRQIWRNSTNSSTGAYITYSYDGTANGNRGVGHITGEAFTGGPNNTLSGSYAYIYDTRGQQTSETETVGGTGYTVQTSYDDGGNVLSQTYPDGEVVSNGYTAQGWLAGVSTQAGTTTTTLLSNTTYTGAGGAGHLMTGASLGGGTYGYSATYDALLRLSDVKVTRSSDSATLFEETRGFDSAGNVTTLTTTLPQGTDVQAFCYDEQNRLTWASSASGTIPCGGTNTAGTLTAASYTQSLAYDNLGRLTTGPAGTDTYGDSAHLHAVTSTTGGYTAAYDAAGNMTCRAPTSASACSGTPTGAQLGWDAEGRLNSWQNTPTSPSSTDGYLYDGEGNRVEQQVTTGLPGSPTTTTTVYVGNLEEIATSGTTTNTTTYYYAGTLRIALAVNGTFDYLATDALGSSTVAFNASGTPVAAQLYAPYGAVRYSNGTMPGSYGFVGQHADAATGLDYFNARYYDPTAGQFVSADTALPSRGSDPWALSRYAYVEGNPLIRLDPTGHDWFSSLATAASSVTQTVQHVASAVAPAAVAVLDATTGIPSMIHDVQTIFSGNASTMDKVMAGADLLLNVVMDVSMVVGVGEGLRAAYVGAKVAGHVAVEVGEHVAEHAGEDAVEHVAEHEAEDAAEHAAEDAAEGCGMSFSPDTLVATASGTQIPIVALKVGDKVLAYDPQTGKAGVQTVEHTFINHDTDLLDVTLRVTSPAHASVGQAPAVTRTASKQQGQASTPGIATGTITTRHDEMVHTTANHPWLSADHGWLPASFLHVGEPVVQLDGATATVVAIHAVAGAADMWDLTVSNVHTFAVGVGKYVVHNNKVCQVTDRDLYRRGNTTSPKMDHVREGKDIPDGADMARNTDKVIVDGRERVMGQSTFEGMAPGKGIWRLPSGTNLGELGLRVINDEGDHWAVQPLEDMSKSAYKAALEQLNRLFTPSW